MKYAKFSDDFLSDFRLDDGGKTLVLTDKRGFTRAVRLLPYEEKTQDDLISREALKKAIRNPNDKRYLSESIISLVFERIDNATPIKFSLLPADESKEEAYMRGYNRGKAEGILKARARPLGEWIYNDKLKKYYCKDCGLLEPFTKEEVEEGVKLPNFCENCGADMRNTAKPKKEVLEKLGECKCNTCKHNRTLACVNKCNCFDNSEV